MREHLAYVDLLAVVVDRRNEPRLVPSDIEYRESSDLIGTGEDPPNILKRVEIRALHDSVPCRQRRRTLGVLPRELVQTSPRGLPEAVLAHGESAGSPLEVAAVHRSIAETYEDDFAKYARDSQLVRLQRLFRSIPGSVGRKVTYRALDQESRAAEVRDAIELLVKGADSPPRRPLPLLGATPRRRHRRPHLQAAVHGCRIDESRLRR